MNNKPENVSQQDWDTVDSPPLSEEMLARMKPVKEAHPSMPRRVRGKQQAPLKIPVSIRLYPEIVDYFKSQGKGWQTKVSDVLGEYVTAQKGKK